MTSSGDTSGGATGFRGDGNVGSGVGIAAAMPPACGLSVLVGGSLVGGSVVGGTVVAVEEGATSTGRVADAVLQALSFCSLGLDSSDGGGSGTRGSVAVVSALVPGAVRIPSSMDSVGAS